MKRIFFLSVFCFFGIAGVPRFLSLDAHWSSDEARWLRRSTQFMSAAKKGQFSETVIAYHPGVMTMWIAGLRTFFTESGMNTENLARARCFIGIVVWAGIGVACLLLYQLLGRWVAFASFACLAYSPLFLAQARRVHTDALAAIFILLTMLLFLIYCKDRQHYRYLIFSGVTFGLAVLSKSYALILLPWVLLCLFLFREKQTRHFSNNITETVCFLNCTTLTIFFLWPIFWTVLFGLIALSLLVLTLVLLRKPFNERSSIGIIIAACIGLGLTGISAIQTVWNVFDRINWAVTTPHEVKHFFLGKAVNDPGWLFYLFVLTIKSTPLILPLTLVGCILLWKRRKRSEETLHQFQMALALVAGVVLFTACLSATSKKFSRYLLPAFLMLEILTAIGFIEGIKWSYAALRSRFGTAEAAKYKIALAVIACTSFFLIQAAPVLARHPYYGTYYNLCWKLTDITKIITVGEASGLDIAANYLNQKPSAHRLRVQVSPLATEFVQYYFQGFTYRADRQRGRAPDYEVVYIRDSQIGRVPQTGTLNGKLEVIITLNGIDQVWIYRVQ